VRAAGFIGCAHMTAELLRRAVRVLDNFSTGSRENLAAVGGEVELVEGDIRGYERTLAATRGVDCRGEVGGKGRGPARARGPGVRRAALRLKMRAVPTPTPPPPLWTGSVLLLAATRLEAGVLSRWMVCPKEVHPCERRARLRRGPRVTLPRGLPARPWGNDRHLPSA